MKKNLVILVALIVIIIGAILIINQSNTPGMNKSTTTQNTFQALSAQELDKMLESKDFVLIDVHTPEQQHVPKTDYLIPYNQTETLVRAIPDKNQKVVLYCRSGNMSKIAAQELVDRGYTNIFDLNGGMKEWLGEDRETLPVGSIVAL